MSEQTEAPAVTFAAVVARLWLELDDPSTEIVSQVAPGLAAALDALSIEQLELDGLDGGGLAVGVVRSEVSR